MLYQLSYSRSGSVSNKRLDGVKPSIGLDPLSLL
jgi:hypothetical protein